MNKYRPKQKRILVRLSDDLFQAFSTRARTIGVPRSKLLLSWLKNDDLNIHTATSNGHKSRNFEFVVSKRTHSRIEKAARKALISPSEYIRLIVTANLQYNPINHNHLAQINNAIQTENLSEIEEQLSADLDKMSMSKLIDLALTKVLIGKFNQVLEIIAEVERRNLLENNELSAAYGNILQAYTLPHLNNTFDYSEQLLNDSLCIVNRLKRRELYAYLYFGFANHFYYKNDIHGAIRYNELAMDYIDPIEYPSTYATICIDLSWFSTQIGEWELAQKYQVKAENICKDNPIPVVLAALYRQRSVLSINIDSKMTVENLNRSYDYIRQARTLNEKVFTNNDLTKIHLYNGDYASAQELVEESRLIEQSVSSKISLGKAKLWGTFIESKYNYEKGVKSLEAEFQMRENYIEKNVRFYIYGITKLIHGTDEKERSEGRRLLKEFSQTVGKGMYKQAAEFTLQTGRVYPAVG